MVTGARPIGVGLELLQLVRQSSSLSYLEPRLDHSWKMSNASSSSFGQNWCLRAAMMLTHISREQSGSMISSASAATSSVTSSTGGRRKSRSSSVASRPAREDVGLPEAVTVMLCSWNVAPSRLSRISGWSFSTSWSRKQMGRYIGCTATLLSLLAVTPRRSARVARASG